ncbi:hypothetical protein M514_04516 [Trichuris suis]|uniref:C2H2-type domain-containing protein n=1 Tax=Trichuris suis TaxID=68888 RepID=A0A085N610_9BILA|nr:hypothetical protein M513_04516 [Trichuris suis]KFD64906.1 hypothetical protein M514_04516 [Trichuris suis]
MDSARINPFSLVDSRFMCQAASAQLPSTSDNVGKQENNPSDKVYTSQNGKESYFAFSKDTSVKMYHPASKKTDFCQDRPFFCERCWKGYYSRHKFEEHVKQHVKCSFDGCSFEALPYHVAKHTINAHSNSVFPANLGAHMKGLQRKHHRVGRTPSKKKELHNDVPTTSVDHSEKGRRENRPESKRRAQVEQRAEESIFHDLDKILNGATVTPKVKFELCDATCPLEKINKEDACYEKALLLQCTRYVVDNLLNASV